MTDMPNAATPTSQTGPAGPEILSPAGDMSSALAGLAAGADALYLGLKHFSARMQADNFSTSELASLLDLAHARGRKIYVAMNTFFAPDPPPASGATPGRHHRPGSRHGRAGPPGRL